jgi:hypothetical protein
VTIAEFDAIGEKAAEKRGPDAEAELAAANERLGSRASVEIDIEDGVTRSRDRYPRWWTSLNESAENSPY